MSTDLNKLSISNIDSVADYYENDLSREQRTKFVRFCNNTHDFSVEVFLYEVRQKRNLPPPRGYDEWTGVTVGTQNIERGECRDVYLQKRVIGDFADAGLLNIKHVPSGRVIRTFNFPDQVAPQGKYFNWVYFGLIQRSSAESSVNLEVELKGYLSDGQVIENNSELEFQLT